jgi:tellurite methyltransferase
MDKNYWNNYYRVHGNDKNIVGPSSFAQFCLNNFFSKKNLNIVELGSGNGRDALFFAHHDHSVVAIDQSLYGIETKMQKLDNKIKSLLKPKVSNFVQEDYAKYDNIDVFYSRFTIHSITKNDEIILLKNIYKSLIINGLFCIEVRTIKDPLFGKGVSCGENTFIFNKHKRRFIDSNVFRKQVLNLGFRELYFVEENNLSIHKNDNPVLMRIILTK